MTAWIEVDALGRELRSSLGVWCRYALDPEEPFVVVVGGVSDPEQVDLLIGAEGWQEPAVRIELSERAGRWYVRVGGSAAVYRNGPRLVAGERYVVDNGDRFEVWPGTWLRFLDDDGDAGRSTSPLQRVRRAGRIIMFSPTPPDGCDVWRAVHTSSSTEGPAAATDGADGAVEVLVCQRVSGAAADDYDRLERLPGFVDVVHTAAGVFHALRGAAGVSLDALRTRTHEQGATLDPAWARLIVRDVEREVSAAFDAGWPTPVLHPRDIIVTWRGTARFRGYCRARNVADVIDVTHLAGAGPRSVLHMALSVLRNDFSVPSTDSDVADEHTHSLAGAVAALFPEERAAELALLEEVALWSREGLFDLERTTRGRPTP